MNAEPCLLDLDGTLMPSHDVDNACYWAAIGDVFETDGTVLALDGFRNVTDGGILGEWCHRVIERPPTEPESNAVRDRFLARIEAAAEEFPAAFTALPGLQGWLAQRPPGSTAIATGGWGHTARFKLTAAGLDAFALPLASGDDAIRRVDIMCTAREHLGSGFHDRTPTYFGDSTWDLAAAGELEWGFVGVASGARADALRRAGAAKVIPNYRALTT
jgi:beta-phosphoglucomutase-like phosphatase (HAD superfamily)